MRYVFDDYELNTLTCELRRDGVPIPLAPKTYEVLAYLVEHHDRLVSKMELLEQLWPDTYVDDSAVKRNVMAARRALDKSSGGPQRIKTQRGQGYRFIAAVTRHAPPPPAEPAAPAPATTHPGEASSLPQTSSGDASAGVQLCTTCHHTNEPMARFCAACGTPLSLTCSSCHAPVAGAAAFCQACGQTLTGVVSQSLPVEERKLITAFCGVVAQLPAEANRPELDTLHRIMQRVYELARIEVQRYGGTLQYTAGEGFLALFGAPVAQEDHARRALLAALSLQRQLHECPDTEKGHAREPVTLHMALHTGLVVIGQDRDESQGIPSIVGRVITLAAALAQQAAPHTLVASEATLRLLQGEVRTGPMPVFHLQTQGAAMPAYEILEFVPRTAPRELPAGRPRSPFMGREAEFEMLRTRLARAIQGRGQVVAIIGEPGMGKTRLLSEFCKEFRSDQVHYLHGACRSYGVATPYLPLLELLRNAWDLTEPDNAETMITKVTRGLRYVQLEAEALGPYFLSLMGLQSALSRPSDTSPDVLRTRIFAALHQFFLHSSQQRPCIIAIEDMHWIDATSEAYLTALVERLAGMPIFLLLTFRPGYRPTWFDKSYATQVALQPLGYNESLRVLQAALGHNILAENLTRHLLDKAEGNPFFVEELSRTIVEHSDTQHALAVPDTIHAVLAARIDRLHPAAKRLLQTAAVIGTEIPFSLLKTLSTHPEAELQHLLTRLQAAEFLYETRLMPERTYAFKHTLTCDVAYASLLQEHRRGLHVRLAQALEALYGYSTADTADDLASEQVNMLARHTFGGELWDKASFYYRQTGLKAMERSAYREAVTCFEQALESLRQLPTTDDLQAQRIDLKLHLHDALRRLGDLDRSVTILQEAHPLAEALDDARRLGWIYSYLSTNCLMVGDSDGAIGHGQRAQALLSGCEDVALQLDLQLHLGQAYHVRGAYAQAVELLRRNTVFLRASSPQAPTRTQTIPGLHTYAWLVLCLAEMGDFSAATAYAEDALQRLATNDIPYDQVVIYGSSGFLYLRQGQRLKAIDMLERSLDICRTAGIPHMLPTIASHLGAAYAASGRTAEAIALLEQATTTAKAMHIMVYHALSVVHLGEAYLLAGRRGEAYAQATHALTLCQDHKEWGHQAWCLRLLGEIAAHGDASDLDQAIMYYQQALEQARELGMRPLRAHCQFALGPLCHQRGNQRQAHDHLSAAIDLYRSMDMRHGLVAAEAILAQLFSSSRT